VKKNLQPCQYNYQDLTEATLSDSRLALPLRRHFWKLKRYLWYLSVLGPFKFMKRIFPSTTIGKIFLKRKKLQQKVNQDDHVLNLQPGEWVEVRSVKEIFETLNAEGKHKGLRFTPEMVKFCGKRFRVYKRLDKLILEATGELRRIKTPTVLLEGVFCDGKAHGGCDRSCFCFWREAWLKKVSLTEPV